MHRTLPHSAMKRFLYSCAPSAVLPVILRARNSSQARDPTHRPAFTALTSVLCCQLPASIGPCVLPALGCAIPPELFMLKTKGCLKVVQATKLGAICASDREQAGKFVNGQWYSLRKASFLYIGMDSCVVPLGDSGYSLVQTIDYFYPSVEDPYIAGKIACANVLSDLYALGVTRCDNVLMVMAASTKLTEKQRDIVVPLLIRRVKDLAEQAGTRVTGGQTMLNSWPMIGGVASSLCRESEIISPDNAQPGDVLVLTKPLGTQVAVNAHQWLEKPERHA